MIRASVGSVVVKIPVGASFAAMTAGPPWNAVPAESEASSPYPVSVIGPTTPPRQSPAERIVQKIGRPATECTVDDQTTPIRDVVRNDGLREDGQITHEAVAELAVFREEQDISTCKTSGESPRICVADGHDHMTERRKREHDIACFMEIGERSWVSAHVR